jgi:vacuolar-type H+-ATPase subunit C/Vma6
MSLDITYTNGVIAAREKYLLKDKIFKLCEGKVEDAYRLLLESGYGAGAEFSSAYDYETPIAAEEAAVDDFIREYAPSKAEKAYLLAPRDFHNAKALVKAKYLHVSAEKMLASDGEIPASEISKSLASGNYSAFSKELCGAISQASALFEESENVSGADIGRIFEKAQFDYLSRVCARNGVLKKLLTAKADMTNILTAMRSATSDFAEKMYVSGGKLTNKQLAGLFNADSEKADRALEKTPYEEFSKKCLAAKRAGKPQTETEKILDSYEIDFFAERKYELEKNQPFLYYVLRRRAENADVRIVFVCLLSGMNEQEIKKRLRSL